MNRRWERMPTLNLLHLPRPQTRIQWLTMLLNVSLNDKWSRSQAYLLPLHEMCLLKEAKDNVHKILSTRRPWTHQKPSRTLRPPMALSTYICMIGRCGACPIFESERQLQESGIDQVHSLLAHLGLEKRCPTCESTIRGLPWA